MPGAPQQFVTATEQAKVDAPRVDADALNLIPKSSGSDSQAVDDIFPDIENIPVQPLTQPDPAIFEAMDFIDPQVFTGKRSGTDATARCAQIIVVRR